MVSKFDHALLHLLYQIRVGWLRAEVVAIVSNHADARRIADAIGERARQSKVDDPDFAHYGYDQLATVRGVFRSSLIVDPPDGKIPYSPAGVELAERFGRLESYGYDHPEERPPYERCVSGILAAPIRTLALFIPIRIVQTSDRIVMTNEDAQGLRIVPIGEPLPPEIGRAHV